MSGPGEPQFEFGWDVYELESVHEPRETRLVWARADRYGWHGWHVLRIKNGEVTCDEDFPEVTWFKGQWREVAP